MGHNHARLDAAPAPQHSATLWPARMLPGCPGAADKIRVQYPRPYPRQHKLIHPLRGGRRAPPGRAFTTRSLGNPARGPLASPDRPAALTCEGASEQRLAVVVGGASESPPGRRPGGRLRMKQDLQGLGRTGPVQDWEGLYEGQRSLDLDDAALARAGTALGSGPASDEKQTVQVFLGDHIEDAKYALTGPTAKSSSRSSPGLFDTHPHLPITDASTEGLRGARTGQTLVRQAATTDKDR